MSDNSCSFATLPWKIPSSPPNFVPERSHLYAYKTHLIFIAWRCDLAVVLIFHSSPQNLSTRKPQCSQVISSKKPILDVVIVNNILYFVSSNGLFQALHSNERSWFGEVLDHLAFCQTFCLVDAFELSPLKQILAVKTLPENEHAMPQNYFAVVTCSKGGSKIDAELYLVLQSPLKTACSLEFVICISSNSLFKEEKCFCTFLTQDQGKHLFPDLKEAEIMIAGLESGQLFCLPFFISPKNYGIKPTARLIYQSHMAVTGLCCPPDGCSVLMFLSDGTCLNISAQSKESKKFSYPSLSYNSFTLPYPMKSFSAPKVDLLIVSNTISTSVVNVVSPNQADVLAFPVKGVTALSLVPGNSLIVASTFHNVFYLLDPSNSFLNVDREIPPWTGCSLDVSLQLVQDMKIQAQLLSQLQNEIKEEDNLIKALSAVARAPFLSEHFVVTVEIIKTFADQEEENFEENFEPHIKFEKVQEMYQMSVEIKNNSPEDFAPPLWRIHLEIRNPDGMTMSKNVALSRILSQESPFLVMIDVPYEADKFSFPIQVTASLISEVKDEDKKNQWLKICLSSVLLDISHFFTLSFQPPKFSANNSHDIATFCNLMQEPCNKLDRHERELKEKALITSFVIPVPDMFRQPAKIIEKILSNCKHRHQLVIEKDFYDQNDKTVIWLSVQRKTVKLTFRKSCVSLTISSNHLNLLHSIKLCLSSMLNRDNENSSGLEAQWDSSVGAAFCKAKNLNAVLETLSLDEVQDGKQLLVIYQDLRSNVSSQIY